jgi:hypothetical protein
VIVEEGSVISIGVSSADTPSRGKGRIIYGRIPAGSVVVSAACPRRTAVQPVCAIVKKVDENPQQGRYQQAAARSDCIMTTRSIQDEPYPATGRGTDRAQHDPPRTRLLTLSPVCRIGFVIEHLRRSRTCGRDVAQTHRCWRLPDIPT